VNEIIWVKKNNMTRKGWSGYRCFAPITERILFFSQAESEYEMACDGLVCETFTPLREYLISEKDKVGITQDDVNMLCGTASMAGRHYFARSQWCFPTREHYERMQLTFNVVFKKLATVSEAAGKSNDELRALISGVPNGVLRKDYDELRRYFSPKQDYTDVWVTNLTNSKEEQIHPTQKPVEILRRMIESTTREEETVLDPFAGSGSTGVAALHLRRNFIGIEISEAFYKAAQNRLVGVKGQAQLVGGEDE
jgi:site-specific DNA-methyltransferase (adenine-specific)